MRQKNLDELRKDIVKASFSGGEGHIPSALSILDILWVLYSKILKVTPQKRRNPTRDWFILSKGQASLGLYSVLARKKFFPQKMLREYGKFDGILGGHPDRNKIPGVEASTGSLGHGFPMAIGVAKGLKIQNIASSVFVLIGDGECNEGTIWESALVASHHKLDNLCCIVDHNHSTDRALSIDNLENKFKSFNWVVSTIDGHNHRQIEKALKTKHPSAPLAIIAKTVKGRGVKMMENEPAWHHRTPTREELETILKELS